MATSTLTLRTSPHRKVAFGDDDVFDANLCKRLLDDCEFIFYALPRSQARGLIRAVFNPTQGFL
jgi:hypothetical protein